MNYLICPKCNEMNTGSTIFCSSCGESLRGAKVITSSNKAYTSSSGIERQDMATEPTAYGMSIMGVLFVVIPLAVLVSAKNLMPLTGQLFCSLPILFGIGLFVGGINMLRHPEKYSMKKTPAGTETISTQPSVSSSSEKRPASCKYLFDAGDYGGIQYWCENTSSPGLLGQGSRIPLPDRNHISRYCMSNYAQCPTYLIKH